MPFGTTEEAARAAPAASGAPRARRAPAHAFAALAVAAVWLVTALPLAAGAASCPTARFLHVACPGCGMTRAMHLLFHGDVAASLAMHPLAAPTALTQLAFAFATVAVTYAHGTPLSLWSSRPARVTVYAAAVVLGATFLLWIARLLGFFGGPVAV